MNTDTMRASQALLDAINAHLDGREVALDSTEGTVQEAANVLDRALREDQTIRLVIHVNGGNVETIYCEGSNPVYCVFADEDLLECNPQHGGIDSLENSIPNVLDAVRNDAFVQAAFEAENVADVLEAIGIHEEPLDLYAEEKKP